MSIILSSFVFYIALALLSNVFDLSEGFKMGTLNASMIALWLTIVATLGHSGLLGKYIQNEFALPDDRFVKLSIIIWVIDAIIFTVCILYRLKNSIKSNKTV